MTDKPSLQQRLGQTKPLMCAWLNLPGAFQAGLFASSGCESVLIDMQHGVIGYNDMVAMVQAVNAAGAYAFVRPPLEDFGMVSRALDVGAVGIVCPMINNADDARRLVSAAKFPPVGERSWGGYLGQAKTGLSKDQILATGNKLNAIFAMVETAEAMENLDDICAVEGLDGVFVGPNDLCISLTNGARIDVEHEVVLEALPKIVSASRKAGISAGIFTSSMHEMKNYEALGFSFMTALHDVAFTRQNVERLLGEIN